MLLEVLLFAGLRQRWGAPTLQIELASGCSARDLKQAIKIQMPVLLAFVDACRVAQGQRFLHDDELLNDDGELALIPPVSGGIDLAPIDQRGAHSRLTSLPLDLNDVLAQVTHVDAGGINLFIGNVRRQSRGHEVTHLEYEAYAPMAVQAMDAIVEAIHRDIPGTRVAIAHRIGHLQVGESAVIIAAAASHRAEAFAACRRAIEDLKRDVPIWKKEFSSDGAFWIGQGP